jgi:hypothetical protein
VTRKPNDSFFSYRNFVSIRKNEVTGTFWLGETSFLKNTDSYKKIHNSDTVSLYIKYNEKKGDVPYVRK